MILIIGGAFQGKKDFAVKKLKIKEDEIFNGFHNAVMKRLEKGENAESLIDEIFQKGYKAVISDEIGCGIVPLEKKQRDRREITGRLLCQIAERCGEVWRVQMGIGIKIKGEADV